MLAPFGVDRQALSDVTIDGDLDRRAELPHPFIIEPSEALYQDRDGDALHCVKVHPGSPRNWIVARFQYHLAV